MRSQKIAIFSHHSYDQKIEVVFAGAYGTPKFVSYVVRGGILDMHNKQSLDTKSEVSSRVFAD